MYKKGMSHNTTARRAVPLHEIPAVVAHLTGARPPHYTTVSRWFAAGANGKRLRTMKLAGRRYVKVVDLAAFLGLDVEEVEAAVGTAAK